METKLQKIKVIWSYVLYWLFKSYEAFSTNQKGNKEMIDVFGSESEIEHISLNTDFHETIEDN